MQIEGAVVAITGASGGMGEASARYLAERGAKVVLGARNEDRLLEIDWQGARQVRRIYPDCVGIFLLPPSVEELEKRMRSRAQDSEEVIRRRLANAREELAHATEFEYRIINKDFDSARQELARVIAVERAKT